MDSPPAKGFGEGAKAALEQVKTVVFKAGQTNDFGVKLDASLADAYKYFLQGEPDKTLSILNGRKAGSDHAICQLESGA